MATENSFVEPDEDDDGRYQVRLENIFEGPMDLLIYLIRKAEVDIYDIPISRITDEYLAYLSWMKQMNIDFAGDFVLMAATLTHIKSRMLLPVNQEGPAEEDPRLEIARPILEYLRIKSAAKALAQRRVLGDTTFVRQSDIDESIRNAAMEDNRLRVSLIELTDAFQRILDRALPDHRVDLRQDRLSVQDRIHQLAELLETNATLSFEAMFSGPLTRYEIIVTFLAILEMSKIGLIHITQDAPLASISITWQ